MDTRELLNEKFGEMYVLIQQGQVQEAQTVLDELVITLESK